MRKNFRWKSEEGRKIILEVLAAGITPEVLNTAVKNILERHGIKVSARSVKWAVSAYGKEAPSSTSVEKLQTDFTYILQEIMRIPILEAEKAGLEIENQRLKEELRATRVVLEKKFTERVLQTAGAVDGD